jgi:hypothetical protein
MERPQSLRRRHLERISAAAALREDRSSTVPAMGPISLAYWRRPSNDLRQNTDLRFEADAAPDPASLLVHVPGDPHALQALWKALDRAEEMIQS